MKIIVFGAGVTGISSVKALSKLNAKVFLYNSVRDDNYQKALDSLRGFNFTDIEEVGNINWESIDFVLKSPGIRLDNDFLQLARKNNVEILSDIEVAYRFFPDLQILAITGTNGKTTTTSLLSQILTTAGVKNKVVGNIGIGLLWEIVENGLDCVYVLEISSFQLASSPSFRSPISALTNISPDHIDWHGSLDDYVEAKMQITKNQLASDLLIVNADDESSTLAKEITKARVREISTKAVVDMGSYCLEEDIFIDGSKSSIKRSDLSLVGQHNVQNMLFALEMAIAFGIAEEKIKEGIKSFKPIEHRIEPVRELDGVRYYNDSKGTNPDSTIKAIQGFKEDLILIAGGYDKKSQYDSLFAGNNHIKLVILFGQTKWDIKEAADRYKVESIICEDLVSAVKLARQAAEKGDVVLFSPACASWDMYRNFEERGNHFKNLINEL